MLLNLLHKCGVPSDESVPTILNHLKEIAVLVHGNWTIKSEELYPDNTISFHYGLSFEVMRLLRDYIVRYYINIVFISLLVKNCSNILFVKFKKLIKYYKVLYKRIRDHVFECHMFKLQVYERLSVRKTVCAKGRLFEIIDK